jgi:hypothetical protein
MFDPNSLTLGQVSSALRDFTVVGALLTLVWKTRGIYESAKSFFERLTTHMDTMESGMDRLLSNHLFHIEKDLRLMAHRQVRATEAEQVEYEADDSSPR